MKKTLIFFLIICTGCIQEEYKMIDTKSFLIAACFENGIFTGTMDIYYTEEFISFCFLGYPHYCSDDGKKTILKELPRTKEGVLRVCSMWLLKIASDPSNKVIYQEEINTFVNNFSTETEISEAGYGYSKIPIIKVSDSEIQDFYRKALKNRIRDISISELSGNEVTTLKKLVYDYCIDNSDTNASAVRAYIQGIESNSEKKIEAVDAFLIELHPGLYELFTGKEYTPPNEIYPR
jgi:hypothetical protein